jgi:HAE1 family hydrophobic/amphiphilic exporter-1
MLIGMASKNAILIVEFANQLREEGLSITKAVIEACKERLRPILMTALATIIGAIPLLIASGAGAAARQSLGTAIVGGMAIATILSLFIVPTLYITIKTAELNFQKRSAHKLAMAETNGNYSPNGATAEPPATEILPKTVSTTAGDKE